MSEILALVDDLFFLAKIQQTAKLTGIMVEVVSPRNVVDRLIATEPRGVIIDLNHGSGAALDALRTIKSTPAIAAVPVLAYLSHVQADLANQAKAAGCDILLARSAFSTRLPELLQRLAGTSQTKGT